MDHWRTETKHFLSNAIMMGRLTNNHHTFTTLKRAKTRRCNIKREKKKLWFFHVSTFPLWHLRRFPRPLATFPWEFLRVKMIRMVDQSLGKNATMLIAEMRLKTGPTMALNTITWALWCWNMSREFLPSITWQVSPRGF